MGYLNLLNFQKIMFHFFVLNAEWWIFVWIILTSLNPQIRNLRIAANLSFDISFFQTCIPHPANAGCGRVFICVNFNQPASRIPHFAICALWAYTNQTKNNTNSHIPHLRDAGLKKWNIKWKVFHNPQVADLRVLGC